MLELIEDCITVLNTVATSRRTARGTGTRGVHGKEFAAPSQQLQRPQFLSLARCHVLPGVSKRSGVRFLPYRFPNSVASMSPGWYRPCGGRLSLGFFEASLRGFFVVASIVCAPCMHSGVTQFGIKTCGMKRGPKTRLEKWKRPACFPIRPWKRVRTARDPQAARNLPEDLLPSTYHPSVSENFGKPSPGIPPRPSWSGKFSNSPGGVAGGRGIDREIMWD